MAVLSVFFDESGKCKDRRVISLSGLCATEDTLTRFHGKWRELLRRHNLPYLKASQAFRAHRHLSDVIPRQSIEDRIEALKPFAACIGENLEFALAIAVNVEAFKRTKEHVKKQISGGEDPFYCAFLRIVIAAINKANGAHLSLVCDDDHETAKNCLSIYRRIKNLDEPWRDKLSAITFADDKVFPALQAADMVSGLFRLEGGMRFLGEKYSYRPLIEYMVEDRGVMRTQWGNVFIGECKMAKIEIAWKNKDFFFNS
jgi:hypothetical protein